MSREFQQWPVCVKAVEIFDSYNEILVLTPIVSLFDIPVSKNYGTDIFKTEFSYSPKTGFSYSKQDSPKILL